MRPKDSSAARTFSRTISSIVASNMRSPYAGGSSCCTLVCRVPKPERYVSAQWVAKQKIFRKRGNRKLMQQQKSASL
jgi:hypothetical protein